MHRAPAAAYLRATDGGAAGTVGAGPGGPCAATAA